jgi:lipoate-protein ligase A
VQYLDLTLPDGASNLACDEALLDFAENSDNGDELLRFWEPEEHFVVLGYSNRISDEADLGACDAQRIPILRRFSGGGTVLQGPGCLNYTLLLKNEQSAPMGIDEVFRFALEGHRTCIQTLAHRPVELAGISDLAIDRRKFSGNAQHRKRRFVLLHGTFLLDLDLHMIERCLRIPKKQPEYRQNRAHHDFVTNLGIDSGELKHALRKIWRADVEFKDVPRLRIDELVETRYGSAEWSTKF